MLHACIPSRRTGKSDAIATIMTASCYLTLRREAAGLSRMQVARRLYDIQIRRIAGDRRPRRLFDCMAQALTLIEQLELPGARAKYRPIIDVLGGIFPLDVDVYHQLADEPADRHPRVCTGCGCSASDPCTHDDGTCVLDGAACSICTDMPRAVPTFRVWRELRDETRAMGLGA
ncbi:hypothetical protein [Sphingomonas melonis]|uniref:hypothetical protein n=1 Tax=Sphingomonas melonis TaxID=152682 RepID=UPI0035C87A81